MITTFLAQLDGFDFTIIGILILGVIAGIAKGISSWKSDDYAIELEEYEQELEDAILAKEARMTELERKIEQLEMAHEAMRIGDFTTAQTKALDFYDEQGIHLQVDILEDLQASRINNVESCIQYIETKRASWVLENKKKIFKGDYKL